MTPYRVCLFSIRNANPVYFFEVSVRTGVFFFCTWSACMGFPRAGHNLHACMHACHATMQGMHAMPVMRAFCNRRGAGGGVRLQRSAGRSAANQAMVF